MALRGLGRSNPAVGPLRTNARTNLPPAIMRTNPRTNTPPGLVRPNPLTNRAAAQLPGAKPNAIAQAKQVPAKPGGGFTAAFRRWRTSAFFYPALVLGALGLGLGGVYLARFIQSKSKTAAPGADLPQPKPRPIKSSRAKAVHACNVLHVGPQTRQLWQFDARGGAFVLGRDQSSAAGQSLPGFVAKDWRALWQPKLNLAWLPPEHVFLRVAQFPQSEFAETFSMVEFQLEKLSPLPVGQIVWSIQVLPQAKGNLQTVIIIIVARNVVEEFLGQLEGQGYLADGLELPVLDQLQATSITEDGVWIYPEAAGGHQGALAAWWYGGVLQNLDIITLPAENRPAGLSEQLMQMAWAGEMAGWLSSPPRWHLVAEPAVATIWEPALREGLEQSIEVTSPVPAPKLAALTAARAANAPPQANLLPVEFATRYEQQFHDRLWMRGLAAAGGLYLLWVLYMGVRVGIEWYGTSGLESQVAALGPTYTNAMQLKARYQVLQDRQDLKYAALECWKAVAELMPESLTLDSCHLSDGKKFVLTGTAPGDKVLDINEFEKAMRKRMVMDQLLFDPIGGEHFTEQANAGGATVTWHFTLELKRTEVL